MTSMSESEESSCLDLVASFLLEMGMCLMKVWFILLTGDAGGGFFLLTGDAGIFLLAGEGLYFFGLDLFCEDLLGAAPTGSESSSDDSTVTNLQHTKGTAPELVSTSPF